MPSAAAAAQTFRPESPDGQAQPGLSEPTGGAGTLNDALGRPGALASPAARLQATLGAEFDTLPGEERWPLRWTVAAVFLTCGAFWLSVYFVVAALIG